MSALAGALLDALQVAHDTAFPHQEPIKTTSSGGGASTVVILIGVFVTLALVGALVWLKKRVDG